jgi:hypothetical protein
VRHVMCGFDRAEQLARFPMGLCHSMAKNVVIVPFLIKANIDEALMSRHMMVLMIFKKNRLDRLLKPIIDKLRPGYLIETRHE